MLIQDAAKQFSVHLHAERGCSRATVEAYRGDIAAFLRYLEETDGHRGCAGQERSPAHRAADEQQGCAARFAVEQVTVETARGWIAHMADRGLKPATRARRLSCLRSLFEFLIDIGAAATNPFRRVRMPKKDHQPPTYLSPDECRRLLAATDDNHYTVLAFRDRAALSLLLFAGLRRSELLGLRVGDVDLQQRTLRVRVGKGQRGRVLPLAEAAAEAVADWLELRPEGTTHDALLTTRGGAAMCATDLQRMFKRTVQKAGIVREGLTLHKLRHTCATLLLGEGVDIVAIQRLLGHASIESTAVYLHVEMSDLRRAVERHPLG